MRRKVRALARKPSDRDEIRKVVGLRCAELRDLGPFTSEPKSRISSVKRGNAYERVVERSLKRRVLAGELLGELRLQQWILFADVNGVQWARPDAYLIMDDGILLMEAKLTQTDSASKQLLGLYLPLLRQIYNVPILCLQVCKNLRYVPHKLVEHPAELIEHPGPGVYTWQLR